eukprot:scaffold191271_cov48-Attheya_sp.AAC.2
MADSSDETRVGTPCTRRTQREPFDAFSSKVPRKKWRRGKETSETSIVKTNRERRSGERQYYKQ